MWTLFLLAVTISAGCSAPADPPDAASAPFEFAGPMQEVLASEVDDQETAIEQAAQVREELDSLRCFLLHKAEAAERKTPRGWIQPEMSAYELSGDPCSLLPGFEDPKRDERDRLESMKENIEEQEEGAPPKIPASAQVGYPPEEGTIQSN